MSTKSRAIGTLLLSVSVASCHDSDQLKTVNATAAIDESVIDLG